MSPPVTRGQLTLDGLVSQLSLRACALSVVEVCTLYLVFKEPRTLLPFPRDTSSNLLDLVSALFGGTFQTYFDLIDPVNHFFAVVQDIFGHLSEARCVSCEFAKQPGDFQAAATF